MSMENPNNNGKPHGRPALVPDVLSPQDIVARVVVAIDKQGGCTMEFTQGNLPLALHLLSQGVEMVAKLLVQGQQAPPRVIPVTGLPPGMKLK
jgi:hypothetical protein